MGYNSISKKFQYTILVVTFAAIAILAIILILAKYTDYLRERDAITVNYFKEQEAIVKYEVERAVQEVEIGLKSTDMSLDEYKKFVVEKLRTVRFPNKGKELGFFFMRSFDGIQLLSVSLPKLEGTNTSKRTDPDGIVTHEVFMDIMNSDTCCGYADYSWYNPVTKEVQKKRSFVKAIPELNCYLGAGFWFKDINTVIHAKKQQLIKDVWYYIFGIIIITIIFYLLIYSISKGVTRKIKDSFEKFALFFKDAANQHAKIETSDLHYKEFEDLALAANQMISERIQAEENVKVMAHALESISDCVTITDLDNNVIYVNDSFVKIYGYTLKEIEGKKMDIFGSSKNPLGLHNDIREETIHSGWEGELWNTRKDGSEFRIYLSSSVVKNLKGETVALVGVSKDITEQKRNELLQRIIYNIAQAANTASGLDELLDIIKNQLSQIIDIRNFYIAFYNQKDDTFTSPYMIDENDDFMTWPAGKTFTALVYNTKKPQLLDQSRMQKLKNEGKVEFVGTVPKVWLGLPLKIKGKVYGVFALQNYDSETTYTQDDLNMLEFVSHQMSISIERKKVEEELQKAYEKAKESDRLKSAFLATMSHELRTPLNSVIGFSDIIKEGVETNKLAKYIDIINKSGRHLLEIVEDIFDVTLLEVGQVQLQEKEYSLTEVMNTVDEMIQLEKDKIGSDIDIRFSPHNKRDHLNIYTDKGKLTQIFLNLLKNALKFTHEGYIEYGYKRLKNNPKLIQFYVKDTGIGISQEKQNVIFKIFRQVDETLTRNYGGTGIGLFVAKRYTELLGGKIELESELGQGSTFYVTLPILSKNNKPEDDQLEVDLKDNKNLKGKNILVVEDDEFSMNFLTEFLNSLEINYQVASNGKEAIEAFDNNGNIELVLMDLKMPEMDGFEATKKIKEKNSQVRIIAQTAHAIPGDKEKTIQAGFDDYISKPIILNDLYKILERYLIN